MIHTQMPELKRKINVVVAGHDQKFWMPIQRVLERSDKFEFREDFWQGHDQHDTEHSRRCLDWADVIMAEWTMGNAVWYSRHKKPHQRLISRLHLQERNTPFPGKLQMDNVEQIVFVGEHIQRECIQRFGIPPEKTCVVSNFVDFERYNLPKKPGHEFNLGMVGVVPMRKRLDRAVDLLGRLLETDSRYCLHVKGPRPDSYSWLWARTAEREYYLELWARIKTLKYANRVIFHPPGNDVPEWFQNIGFILSPSDFESFHMAVPEGMSSGTIPVVWDWDGAADIYRMLRPVRCVEEAASLVLSSNQSTAGRVMAEQSRSYVRKNFDLAVTVRHWSHLLTGSHDTSSEIQAFDEVRRVLVVWAIDNWETFHRKEMIAALANNLVGTAKVLVVEPGDDPDELIRRGWETEETLGQDQQKRCALVGSNVWKVRIIVPGVGKKIARSMQIEKYGQIKSGGLLLQFVEDFFGPGTDLLHWIYKPNQTERLARGLRDNFIYEVYDDYTRDFATGRLLHEVEAREHEACKNAKWVFFTAKELAERKQEHCSRFSTIGNGVNFEAFERYRIDGVEPETDTARKSVGYLGNLSDFFDWDLMLHVATALPDVDFHFHGPIESCRLSHKAGVIESLKGLPNTQFSGRVTRDQGAAAIARYDALVIPFVVNEAMHAVNPLKLWEYLAAGKPVLSSRMRAIEQYGDLVLFPDTPEEWVEFTRRAIDKPPEPSLREASIAAARAVSWDSVTRGHAETVKGILEALASGRPSKAV